MRYNRELDKVFLLRVRNLCRADPECVVKLARIIGVGSSTNVYRQTRLTPVVFRPAYRAI